MPTALTPIRQKAARRWRGSPYRPVVADPVLRKLLAPFAVSAVGDGMSIVAVAWLALLLAPPGRESFVVGAAVAAYTLPAAVGALLLSRPLRRLAGVQLVVADSALRTVALAAVPILFVLDALSVTVYVAVLAASSLLHAWGISGRYTIIAEQLPEETRRTANALLSSFDMAALIVGPLLAGLIVTVADPSLAIAADAASFAVLAFVARRVSRSSSARARGRLGRGREAAGSDRGHGFRAILRRPALVGLIVLSWLYFLLYGPVEVALPLFVVNTLGGDAGMLSVFWTVFGIGAVVGSVAAGALRRLPLGPTLIASVIGWGAALIPIGLLHLPILAMVCFAVGGFVYAPYVALSAALFQRESPAALLSQVFAARGAVTVFAAPLGTALGGPLVAHLGAPDTLLASGVTTVVVGLAAVVLIVGHRRRG